MSGLPEVIDRFLEEFLPKSGLIPVGTPKKRIVRDAVWGMIELEPHESILVDTPLFQRLRGISQTGFTYFVYPCAIHTRFEHSLGCLHIAARLLDALHSRSREIEPDHMLTVRLAALLHDVSHCIFSHVSEEIYGGDDGIHKAREEICELFPEDRNIAKIGAAEVIVFEILTSKRFAAFFDELRNKVGKDCLPDGVRPINIARIIVGLPLEEHQSLRFLTQIVNGPFDADKLDYQARDGYFTGIGFRVDIDRLLASLCIAEQDGVAHLAIDYRGVAAIEQLLFNRMLLYDSVYHHHKNRAAVQLFRKYVSSESSLSLDWFMNHDEHDFFGHRDLPDDLHELAVKLRRRELPHRAVVIHPTTVNVPEHEESKWGYVAAKHFSKDGVDRDWVDKWITKLKANMREILDDSSVDIFIDFPSTPQFHEIQRFTYIQYAGHTVKLEDVFPITSTLGTYSQQYKYRVYIFAGKDDRVQVAAAAYKALLNRGIQLNKEAFRLAKLDPRDVEEAAGVAIPDKAPRR